MFQSWRRLLFLHWEIAPETVAATLPAGLVPHLRAGRAYVGVVPFFMRNIRPRGLPVVPWISNFLELNVRTYVLGPDGTPGVWFHSLDTNRRIARILGRGWFHLPYFDARMRASLDGAGFTHYRARRRGQSGEARFQYRAVGDFGVAEPSTLEEFLLERYSLFSWNARTRCLQHGRVHHTPYRFAGAEIPEWSALPARWDGLILPDTPPAHACVAEDVDVSVYALEKVVAPVMAIT